MYIANGKSYKTLQEIAEGIICEEIPTVKINNEVSITDIPRAMQAQETISAYKKEALKVLKLKKEGCIPIDELNPPVKENGYLFYFKGEKVACMGWGGTCYYLPLEKPVKEVKVRSELEIEGLDWNYLYKRYFPISFKERVHLILSKFPNQYTEPSLPVVIGALMGAFLTSSGMEHFIGTLALSLLVVYSIHTIINHYQEEGREVLKNYIPKNHIGIEFILTHKLIGEKMLQLKDKITQCYKELNILDKSDMEVLSCKRFLVGKALNDMLVSLYQLDEARKKVISQHNSFENLTEEITSPNMKIEMEENPHLDSLLNSWEEFKEETLGIVSKATSEIGETLQTKIDYEQAYKEL